MKNLLEKIKLTIKFSQHLNVYVVNSKELSFSLSFSLLFSSLPSLSRTLEAFSLSKISCFYEYLPLYPDATYT